MKAPLRVWQGKNVKIGKEFIGRWNIFVNFVKLCTDGQQSTPKEDDDDVSNLMGCGLLVSAKLSNCPT